MKVLTLSYCLCIFICTYSFTVSVSFYDLISNGRKILDLVNADDQNMTAFVKLNSMYDDLKSMDDVETEKMSAISKYSLAMDIAELNQFKHYITNINFNYYQLLKIYKYTASEFEDMSVYTAQSVQSDDSNSVGNITHKLHAFFKNSPNGFGVLSRIKFALENLGYSRCTFKESPSQILYKLITTFTAAEIRGHILIQLSYLILSEQDKDKYKTLQQNYGNVIKLRISEIVNAAKDVFLTISNEITTCDPKQHREGNTFVQFTNFLQGYIQNEKFLNNDNTCSNQCEFYTSTAVNSPTSETRKSLICSDEVLNCQEAPDVIDVCLSIRQNRRYQYIKYRKDRIWGRQQTCSKSLITLTSWKAVWFIGYKCSNCFCFCNQETNSDRYVSMRSSLANLDLNNVVTGVRFLKKNGLIQLQVQEGKLIAHGQIDTETVRWVPANNLSRFSEGMYLNQDYYRLTLETNSLHLDDIIADEDHVVTGVRFKKTASYLMLEILTTPFNFNTGQLFRPTDTSYWKSNLFEVQREEVKLEMPDVPTLKGSVHSSFSKPYQFIRFTHTDKEKDLAQTTVPFFDAQPVVSTTPSPLSGIGVFHKGRKGSGGFISPKIMTLTSTDYFTVD